jgi:hypothetical protein
MTAANLLSTIAFEPRRDGTFDLRVSSSNSGFVLFSLGPLDDQGRQVIADFETARRLAVDISAS